MKNVLIRNSLLFLFFSFVLVNAKEISFDDFKDNENYLIYDIDIDKDGKLDKVIAAKSVEENDNKFYIYDKLYFFKHVNNDFILLFSGTTFSVDGVYYLNSIRSLNDNGEIMALRSRTDGSSFIDYIINYKNHTWYLGKVIYYIGYGANDEDGRLDICTTDVDISIHDIIKKHLSFYDSYPNDDSRPLDRKCKISFFISENLEQLKSRITDFGGSIKLTQRYDAWLNKYPLVSKTLTQYNNIAYYLQQAGANQEAAYLLEKIIEKFPDRTVAYLNLGDAYYGLGDQTKAIKSYQTYIDQMKKKGWEIKIPKQVLDRIQEAQ